MTFDDMTTMVIDRAGLMARMNRGKAARIVELAVRTWEDNPYEPGMVRRVRKAYKANYTFDPLTWIIISALVSILVRVLLEWIYGEAEQQRTERSKMVWKFRSELEYLGKLR